MLKKYNLLVITLVFLLLRYTLATMIDSEIASDGMAYVFCIITGIFIILMWATIIRFEKQLVIIGKYHRVKKIVLYLACLSASLALILDTLERIDIIKHELNTVENTLMILMGLLLLAYAFWPTPKDVKTS